MYAAISRVIIRGTRRHNDISLYPQHPLILDLNSPTIRNSVSKIIRRDVKRQALLASPRPLGPPLLLQIFLVPHNKMLASLPILYSVEIPIQARMRSERLVNPLVRLLRPEREPLGHLVSHNNSNSNNKVVLVLVPSVSPSPSSKGRPELTCLAEEGLAQTSLLASELLVEVRAISVFLERCH
jgi:hypothetical protein